MILVRYVLKEILIPLVVWIGFLFLLLIVMQFLRGSELLLGSSVTLMDMLELFVYLGPHFLVMAVPIAFMLAILLGLGRLNEDREVLALASLGVSPQQLAVAPMVIGLLLSGALMFLAFNAEPWGLRMVSARVTDVIKRNVIGDVKGGTFYEDLTSLVLFVEKVDAEQGRWENVLLHDDRDPNAPLLVLARTGSVRPGELKEGLKLGLREGEVHRATRASEDYAVVTFERGDLAVELGGYSFRKNRFPRSPKEEMFPGELLEAAEEAEKSGHDSRPFLMAFHGRLGRAFTPFAFAVLGAPLALARSSAGRARGFLLTILGYIGYYVLNRLADGWGVQGKLPVELAAQLANLVFVVFGLVALSRIQRVRSPR